MKNPDYRHDPFARSALPDELARRGFRYGAPGDLERLEHGLMLRRGAEKSLKLHGDDRDVAFTNGGLLAWLERGGNLFKNYWQITPPPGSTHDIWWLLQSERNKTNLAREDD